MLIHNPQIVSVDICPCPHVWYLTLNANIDITVICTDITDTLWPNTAIKNLIRHIYRSWCSSVCTRVCVLVEGGGEGEVEGGWQRKKWVSVPIKKQDFGQLHAQVHYNRLISGPLPMYGISTYTATNSLLQHVTCHTKAHSWRTLPSCVTIRHHCNSIALVWKTM